MAYTTINKSTDYFSADTWSGNSSTQAINVGKNFSSNGSLIWIKGRNGSGKSHRLLDSVRGKGNLLASNSTDAQFTESGDGVASYSSTGFNLQFSSQNDYNESGGNYVGWNWLAGSSPTGSANTDGSLNSTVSVNTTAGFSIVKYTAGNSGAVSTIGHGLNAVPKVIIVKGTDANSTPDQWMVYHEALGNTKRIKLNSTDASATGSGYWNNTTPTSSLFTVGGSSEGNSANGIYIAYCFAEKTGYSKFGSYAGNGSTDGTFVYTGFKPAFIMLKKYNAASYWSISDNKRVGYNGDTPILRPNTNEAEADIGDFDLLSNGFKIRANTGNVNGANNSYIYMAFAEAPLVGTNGVTAKAR